MNRKALESLWSLTAWEERGQRVAQFTAWALAAGATQEQINAFLDEPDQPADEDE